ncbi:MAG: universal stress protein, partial [Sphingomonadales bacterium]|nr:universal stress protein [Sphingomonadales bacterium]
MRSILLPVTEEDGLDSRLQVALDIGRGLSGHIQFFHASPAGEYIAADPFGGAYYAAYAQQAINEETDAKHALVRERMADEDVPWDFLASHGALEHALAEHSRLADLLVLSEPPDWGDEEDTASEISYLAVEAHCPIFAVPRASRALDCSGKAMIAWNGSAPAA